MTDPRRSPERAALLTAVERVRDAALAHADEAERRRTLAPAVVDALHSVGLFAMAAPRALGGAECDPLTQIEVFEAMARIDTSAGWSLMIGAMTTAMAGGYLPDAGAARVFAGATPICAGLQQPAGVARRAPGGYVVSGRWPFGSGVRHAGWVLSGAVVEPAGAPAVAGSPGGPPELLTFAVPAGDVRIEDTWHSSGLRGSGSDHYRVEGVFVPEELTFPFPAAAPRRGGPLYALPFIAFVTPAHVGFALGAARGALDEIIRAAPRRTRLWTGVQLGDHAAFQMDLGRAEAKLGAARAYALAAVGAAWDRVRAGDALSLDDWSAVRLAATYVTEVAAEVISFAYRSGGASALYSTSPLQRYFRDIHAATQHIAATDDAYEAAGRARLGIATPHPFFAPRPPLQGA